MTIEIPRPAGGDVVELILSDHRLFEELLRRLRDETDDRVALRSALADVLVAHAEAEEQHVYPTLVRKDAIGDEEAAHGEHEHDEGHEALLALLQVEDPSAEDFGEALEEVTKALAHHLDEEERDILNPARTDVAEDTRAELGERFSMARSALLDDGCGNVDNVRRLVERAKQRGD